MEIVTPRTNAAIITPAENLLAAISLPEPFSLEIVGTQSARWFLARAVSPAMRQHLESQLAVAYPQAEIRQLDLEQYPGLDPARLQPGEQVCVRTLVLRAPPYLPIRTFRDADVEATRNSQADPVLGILSALGDLPEGWRGLAQLVLRPVSDDWCSGYLRMAVEHPLASERVAAQGGSSLTQVVGVAVLLVLGGIAVQGYGWYRHNDWLHLGFLIAGLLAAIPAILWVARRFLARPVYDMRLVQEKVSRIAYRVEIRLAVFAPSTVPLVDVDSRLQQLTASYRQFNLAAGNGFVSRRLKSHCPDLRQLDPVGAGASTPVLNTRELAGLWHLPQAQADVPLLERTTARRRLPMPFSVSRGCFIGQSSHQGRSVPVAIPEEILARHLLLVAKTRRGKSSLLLRIGQHIMASGARSAPGSLVLVDPHRDLARAALGLVPPVSQDRVVYLDVAEQERPFGLNLLDAGLGWQRDKAVSNCLAIFEREFGGFWGPRMEDAFRFALLTLFEANQSMCREPNGRARQHTILEVPALLSDPAFRQSVLPRVVDPLVKAWWKGYFDGLDRRLQVEIINPVQTKTQKFAGSYAARSVVGQPRSTIDPLSWPRSGAIVIVNTAKGTVGEDTSALLGATLLNLVALGVAERAALPRSERRPVTFIVDEFHSMPGADYESILAELAKYGASLILATQSLAAVETVDRDQGRSLRAKVFSNLDGLFAFHTSAEDARYLVPELGEHVDVHDLVALGEHQCYARISAGGDRLPAFSVHLDPPPPSNSELADRLALESATRYGRDGRLVERDLRSALARIEATHRSWGEATAREDGTRATTGHDKSKVKNRSARSEHRNLGEAQQKPLPGIASDGNPVREAERDLADEAETAGEQGVA